MTDIVLHLRLSLFSSFSGNVERVHLSELEGSVFDAAFKWLLEHPQYPCSCLVSDKTCVEFSNKCVISRSNNER